MRKDILERKDDILRWISENQSKAFMCKELSCKTTTLNSYLDKMGIKYKGNQSHKGFNNKKLETPIEKYLNNEIQIASYRLKNKLINEGIKEMKCESCGLEYWKGVVIPLELHHIDGNHFNNNLDNLKLLCPNCHALTDNYRGRGTKSYKSKRNKKNREYKNHLHQNVVKENHCIDCGKAISDKAKRCKSCASKMQRKKCENRPSRRELKYLIRNNPILQIAKNYDVSDNAIRKWCKQYDLPYKSREIKRYTDNEWEEI